MQLFLTRLNRYYDRLNTEWLKLRQVNLVSQQDAKRPLRARQLDLVYCREQISKSRGLYWPEWTAFLEAETAADPEMILALTCQLQRREPGRGRKRQASGEQKNIPEPPPEVLAAWVEHFNQLIRGAHGN